MFHRIRAEKKPKAEQITTQNNKLASNLPRRQVTSKSQVSYSQKYKKINSKNGQMQPDSSSSYEIVKSQNYVFQGLIKDGMKQGEGVLMTRGGMMVIGRWWHDQLHGRAMIFTAFGGRILANFNEGKLSGWTFALFGDRLVVCLLYYQNRIDGQKLTYEDSQKLWVASRCFENGKVKSISHVQKGTSKQLPSFVASNDLQQLYYPFIKDNSPFLDLQFISYLPVNSKLTYIGFSDGQNRPHGLGAIYSKQQSYFGHYFQGTLEVYGRMIFANGEIYHGGLQNGLFSGRGVYYKPQFNVTSFLQTEEEEQGVIDEHCGYVMIDIEPGLGKNIPNRNIGIKGCTLNSVCENIQMYYLRYFVQKNKKIDESMAESNGQEYGRSEDMDDISPVLNGIKPGNKNKQNKDVKDTPLSVPYKKQQKWIKLDSPPDMDELNLKRKFSLDKRQAQRLNFQNANNNKDYQTTQVRQNTKQQERENYRKNTPRAIAIHEVPFQKAPSQGQKSLQINQIALRQVQVKKSMTSNTNQEVNGDRLNDRSQSQVSKSSQKLNTLMEHTRSNRKRIFN